MERRGEEKDEVLSQNSEQMGNSCLGESNWKETKIDVSMLTSTDTANESIGTLLPLKILTSSCELPGP